MDGRPRSRQPERQHLEWNTCEIQPPSRPTTPRPAEVKAEEAPGRCSSLGRRGSAAVPSRSGGGGSQGLPVLAWTRRTGRQHWGVRHAPRCIAGPDHHRGTRQCVVPPPVEDLPTKSGRPQKISATDDQGPNVGVTRTRHPGWATPKPPNPTRVEVHAVVAREGGVIQEVGDRPGFKLVLNGGTGGDATPQGLLRRSQVKIERVEVQPVAGPQVTGRREASDMGGWRTCEGRSGAKAPCAAERGEPSSRPTAARRSWGFWQARRPRAAGVQNVGDDWRSQSAPWESGNFPMAWSDVFALNTRRRGNISATHCLIPERNCTPWRRMRSAVRCGVSLGRARH